MTFALGSVLALTGFRRLQTDYVMIMCRSITITRKSEGVTGESFYGSPLEIRMLLAVLVAFVCSCGASSQDVPIQTFVIPHSHMDVGWVYTIQVGSLPLISSVYPSHMCVHCYYYYFLVFDWYFNVHAGEHARLCSQRVQQRDGAAFQGRGAPVHRRGAGVLQAVVGHCGFRCPEETSKRC